MADKGRLLCLVATMVFLFIAFLEVAGSNTVFWPPLAWVLLAGVAYVAREA